jgi:hypothetical protein
MGEFKHHSLFWAEFIWYKNQLLEGDEMRNSPFSFVRKVGYTGNTYYWMHCIKSEAVGTVGSGTRCIQIGRTMYINALAFN